MTTVLADSRLGVMVCDSNVTDDDRVWTGKKVWRVGKALIGMAGDDAGRAAFLEWYRAGLIGTAKCGNISALILTSKGLFAFDSNYTLPQKVVGGIEAIGCGGKAAMCAYEALGYTNAKRAVQIVCKHDAGSRGPVRAYKL